MEILMIVIPFLLAYLLGGIPNSFLAGKLRGIDIRTQGSGNVGATNALRVLGTTTGVIVLLLDAFKGVAAILIGSYLLGHYTSLELSSLYRLLLGLTAILGHVFSIYLKFKGGKGVATAAGVYAVLSPISLLIALGSFIIVVWISRYVSLGSIIAATILVISELVRNVLNDFSYVPTLILTVLLAIFIIVKHKSNIGRLLNGTENKISFKKK